MSISPIHTPCKKCVFAKYNTTTQVGCSLNYLDIYRSRNIEILEVFDNEAEFFVINEKKCPGYREDQWFSQWGMENSSLDDKIIKFKSLNKLNYLLVINFKLIGETKEDIDKLKNSLNKLSITPQKIVFVRASSGGETTTYGSINKLMRETGIDCAWRIQSMIDDSISNENILHNIINANKSYRFVCNIRRSDCIDLDKIIDYANDLVYTKLEQFNVISDSTLSCVLFSGGVYRYALAKEGLDILEDSTKFTIV